MPEWKSQEETGPPCGKHLPSFQFEGFMAAGGEESKRGASHSITQEERKV